MTSSDLLTYIESLCKGCGLSRVKTLGVHNIELTCGKSGVICPPCKSSLITAKKLCEIEHKWLIFMFTDPFQGIRHETLKEIAERTNELSLAIKKIDEVLKT